MRTTFNAAFAASQLAMRFDEDNRRTPRAEIELSERIAVVAETIAMREDTPGFEWGTVEGMEYDGVIDRCAELIRKAEAGKPKLIIGDSRHMTPSAKLRAFVAKLMPIPSSHE